MLIFDSVKWDAEHGLFAVVYSNGRESWVTPQEVVEVAGQFIHAFEQAASMGHVAQQANKRH